MHHYHELVCCTLSGQPGVQQTWQSVIPKEATQHSGLMHGLLAVAALHRSHVDSNGHDRYRNAAMRYQNLSLPYLRSLINNASAENCNALFALSTFVAVFAFALPQSPVAPTKFDPFKEMVRLIEFVKGVRVVAEMTRDWILQGPLRPLLLPGAWEVRLVVPEEIGDALNFLNLCNESLEQSDAKRATYGTAIKTLGQTFEMLTMNPGAHGLGLIWLALMERQYVDLLKAEEPMALVLLAHFGVGLHTSERNWWSGNWGFQLVIAVYDILDDHWRPWIQWPLASVGLRSDAPKAGLCVSPSAASQRPTNYSKTLLDQVSFPQSTRISCSVIGSPLNRQPVHLR